jgi:Rrf2 family protein
LVKKVKIPRTLLRKILQILNRERLLKSYKGKGGGFKLNLIPENIFLLDIIKIFQGPFELNEHILKSGLCPNIKECRLKKRLDEIEEYIISMLKDITLASLIEKGETDGKEKNNKD